MHKHVSNKAYLLGEFPTVLNSALRNTTLKTAGEAELE